MSIGDSITWYDQEKYLTGKEKGEKAIGYQSYFISHQQKSIDLDNQGYSGYSLAGKNNSIYQKVKNKNFRNSDIISIFAGTNDFKLNKPIISKDSLESFKYCYNSLVDKIINQNKNAKIYLITPLRRNNDNYTSTSVNKAGLKLNDYRNEIIRIGKEKNIPVIDLYNSEITDNNLSQYTIDGLHPNNEGHKIIGDILIENIKIK